MKTFLGVMAGLVITCSNAGLAQPLTGPPASPDQTYSTSMPPGVAIPDSLSTRLGPLRFQDGFPDQATADKLLDNLDFQNAVQAYLMAIPAASQVADRNAIRGLGPVNTVVPIWEELVDSRTVGLTFNSNTVYSWTWVDLKDGPLVLEVPPKVLGAANDIWFRWVSEVGITGPDKGEGGKYLLLPPGYQGERPPATSSSSRQHSISGCPGEASWSTGIPSQASIR